MKHMMSIRVLLFAVAINMAPQSADACTGSGLAGSVLIFVAGVGIIGTGVSFADQGYNHEPYCNTGVNAFCCTTPTNPGASAPVGCIAQPNPREGCPVGWTLYCAGTNQPATTAYKSWVLPVGITSALVAYFGTWIGAILLSEWTHSG